MKKSVVLLVTLIIIMSLTLVIFTTQKEVLKLKPIYKNIYISNQSLDIVPFLKTTLADVNSSEALKTFLGIPFPIEKMTLLFSPIHTKVNINLYIDKFPLDKFSDEELFRELIKKISPQNFKEFEEVLAEYYEQTSDYLVYEINWREIIEFEGNKLNVNFLSPSLLDYFEVTHDVFHDALLRGDELSEYLYDINYTTYLPQIEVNIEIETVNTHFIYDLEKKTIDNKGTVFN